MEFSLQLLFLIFSPGLFDGRVGHPLCLLLDINKGACARAEVLHTAHAHKIFGQKTLEGSVVLLEGLLDGIDPFPGSL